MRIISGKYGGRKLVSFQASHIRPTTDRVKEVIFNKIQFDIDGAVVLDLYAGTGNLGFESLSRGASSVEMVESNPKSIEVIRKNQKLLGVAPEELTVVKSDVGKYLRSSHRIFDIALVDPPFTKSIADITMEQLAAADVLKPEALILIESSKKEKIQDQYGSLVLLERKNYGDKFLSIFSNKI